jgi:hypothetical protein
MSVKKSIRQQENPKTGCCQENSLVSRVARRISVEEARALGLWFDWG